MNEGAACEDATYRQMRHRDEEDNDGGMTQPYTEADDEADETAEPAAKQYWNRPRIVIAISIVLWVSSTCALCMSGFIVDRPDGEGLTFVEAIYFMMQILTTVGYGDYTPTTTRGRMVVTFQLAFGVVVIAGVVTEVIDAYVDEHHEHLKKQAHAAVDDGDDEHESVAEMMAPVLTAFSFLALIIAVWVVFFMFFCDPWYELERSVDVHRCEDKELVEAIYFAVTTMTSVGFGDITPNTDIGKGFAAVMAFVGVVTFINFMETITASFLKVKDHYLMQEVTEADLKEGDQGGDGQVDLFEFAQMVLVRSKLVEREVLDKIKKNFNKLDEDGSGFLNMQDLNVKTNRVMKHRHAKSAHAIQRIKFVKAI